MNRCDRPYRSRCELKLFCFVDNYYEKKHCRKLILICNIKILIQIHFS